MEELEVPNSFGKNTIGNNHLRLQYVLMCSVVADSLRPYGLYPARFLCPWNFLGKNTGVGYHFLLHSLDFLDLYVTCTVVFVL